MTPPAWSSFPATGLNFTSTKPSLRLVSFLMQTGKVATPDCLSTFGLLGAESSFSTDHFAEPLPVCVAVQLGGGAPVFASSKLIVSASAVPDRKPAQIISVHIVFIVGSRYMLLFCFVRFQNVLRPLYFAADVLAPDKPEARSAPWIASASFLAGPLPQ